MALINQARSLQYQHTQKSIEIINKAIAMADQHNIQEFRAYSRAGKAVLDVYLGKHAIAKVKTGIP